MHASKIIALSTALALGAAPALAVEPAMEGHISIVPSEIKWVDAPSIGSGAKLAVLEGDLNSWFPVRVDNALSRQHPLRVRG